ncbi:MULTISPECIES: MarR family transcriptional regulator [unclassified Streptomyces]|uniref:MarR family winged helix-turn-helix transcriptional regulator n=1 Tax=unclassified Streptomyces TaxID=2593676 RepID=UPI00336AE186
MEGEGQVRKELRAQLLAAGREHSTAVVMFHEALAAKQDLSAGESKALDLLERHGPLTAGDLSRRSGLAPASVTGLVDRLERKGFARRVKHPEDGRRVLIEANPERLAALAPYFEDFLGSMEELLADYTDEQLRTVTHFLKETARRQSAAASRLAPGE